VCAICMGQKQHNIKICTAEKTWDKRATRCTRNARGRIINPNGTELCTNWQRKFGCESNKHNMAHECAGCGNKDHGAQTCPRAQ
ncbi:hypothetical protein BD779DRAFT_1429123, partial [Infundibulicybe gibba]